MVTGRPDFFIRRGDNLKKFFSYDTRAHINNLFRVVLKGERQIEQIREQLAKRQYMDLHCAFMFIDTDRDDFISPPELRDFFAN